ncbi:DUF2059 domain-containing protein [Flavobacteriaceae bacterium XHP0103]|uniref:DUF2059 domain-containing protein n=1 Tax=Marixanthotalea marina TaxID=2844359 RepID=UPI002989D3D8|nr:DUF2059 domain-containing protein [Marixanthotalea marina]MBU3820676.1 DUF2059 domain-containing protein [Marixanthotalea marina]
MIRTILFLCLMFTAFIVKAQDNTDYKEETIEFIKLTGSGNALDIAITQLGATVPEASKDAYLKEANATLEGLYDKLAELYMNEFTEAEIEELTAFYHSDLGKKLAQKQLGLSQKAMMLSQTWGMEVQGIAQKYN